MIRAACYVIRAACGALCGTQHAGRSTGVAGPARMLALALVLGLSASPAAAQEATGDGSAPLAARDLPRGAVLTAEDVAGRGSAVEGWVTRRMIAEGEPLREPAIRRPDLVRSGEVVQLVWRQGGIELRLVGRAMSSAARGEKVNVRVDSRRRFVGVVEDRALVRMQAGDNHR